MAFNLCPLCQNTQCQNSGHEENGCFPIWNGLALGAIDTDRKYNFGGEAHEMF